MLISFGMTGIAGAGIKFVATMPQFLAFALFAMALRYTSSISFRRLLFFIPVAGVAIVVRVLLSISAGTYIFGPLFFNTSPDLMLQVFPPWLYVLLNIPQAAFSDMSVLAEARIKIPAVVRLAHQLRDYGFEFERVPLTVDDAALQISRNMKRQGTDG